MKSVKFFDTDNCRPRLDGGEIFSSGWRWWGLNLPPRRKRRIHVATLAQEFLIRFAAVNGRKDLVFAPLNAITQHPWPGNVRELQNRVQRAVIMAHGNKIQVGSMESIDASAQPTPKKAREAACRRDGGKPDGSRNGD